jgi:hypothetical protein
MGAGILRRLGPAAALTHAGLSWPLWVVGWYAVHLTRPYTYALEHPYALNVEHAFLILIGLAFWWPVIVPGVRRMGSGVAVLYLLCAFVAASFLGLAYTFIPDPLYPYYVHAPRLWGISAARDQNLGGVLMTAEQSAVFLTAVAMTLLRLLDEDEERGDRQADAALAREAARIEARARGLTTSWAPRSTRATCRPPRSRTRGIWASRPSSSWRSPRRCSCPPSPASAGGSRGWRRGRAPACSPAGSWSWLRRSSRR